jgi:ESCO1/2 acetyl-transferase
VISDANGRIVAVRQADDPKHLERVTAVDEYVSMQLGSQISGSRSDVGHRIVMKGHGTQNGANGRNADWLALLYVSRNRRVIDGYVLSERVASACEVRLASDGVAIASTNAAPLVGALCGVRRIWVAPNARRRGIASMLLDAARQNIVYAYHVPRSHVVFTTPTQVGALFALSYVYGGAMGQSTDSDSTDGNNMLGVYSTAANCK